MAQSLVNNGINAAGVGTKSKRTRTKDLTAGASSAPDGATSRTSAAASPNVDTAQAITGQPTTSAMWWDALQRGDHSAASRWRSAPIAGEITSDSAAGA